RYEMMCLVTRRRVRQFPSDFEARRSAAFRLACEAVQREMDTGGLLRDDPLEATLTLWAHAHGLICLQLVGRFGRDLDMFRNIYARSIARILRGVAGEKDRHQDCR